MWVFLILILVIINVLNNWSNKDFKDFITFLNYYLIFIAIRNFPNTGRVIDNVFKNVETIRVIYFTFFFIICLVIIRKKLRTLVYTDKIN